MNINILAVGRNSAILEIIQRLINAHEGWHAAIATTEEEAIETFKEKPYTIVLISAGFFADEEITLRQKLVKLDPRVSVIRHYGGGSGLLESEILYLLKTKEK